MSPPVSYAQRFEDLYLMRCFGDRSDGFYIDIGSGHPVYDNMSFAFYLKGWRGITVEPNPWLARLTRAVRVRDRHIEALVGAAAGEATFHLVNEFHGLSTMIAAHAEAAQTHFGKASRDITVPVTTLKELCEQHAPPSFEFLKVDVEGAEPDVLLNGDWQRYRPKVVVVEALAPLHAGAGLGGLGTFHDKARLPLCAVRQPQPLLPRGRSRFSRTQAILRISARFLRHLPIPRREARAH